MTCVRKLGFVLKWYELEHLLATYIKLDHAYTARFPKQNMVNLLFVLQFLSLKLGYDHIAEQIQINKTAKAIARWNEKLNLVLTIK
jgi:hypothetical protein